MLRELDINEMNAVSGGTDGEDEVVVTATIIRHDHHSNNAIFSSIEDGSWFLENNFGTFAGGGGGGGANTGSSTPPNPNPTPPSEPNSNDSTENSGSPGIVDAGEGYRCGLIADEERQKRCLANALLR